MSNTITPTVFYRTLNVEGLEIFYREAGPRDIDGNGVSGLVLFKIEFNRLEFCIRMESGHK